MKYIVYYDWSYGDDKGYEIYPTLFDTIEEAHECVTYLVRDESLIWEADRDFVQVASYPMSESTDYMESYSPSYGDTYEGTFNIYIKTVYE